MANIFNILDHVGPELRAEITAQAIVLHGAMTIKRKRSEDGLAVSA